MQIIRIFKKRVPLQAPEGRDSTARCNAPGTIAKSREALKGRNTMLRYYAPSGLMALPTYYLGRRVACPGLSYLAPLGLWVHFGVANPGLSALG